MTQNSEPLENHVLCHVTIFRIEQFPNKRIYTTSTQKCPYRKFLKKKNDTGSLPDEMAFISSLLRMLSIDIAAFKIPCHVAFTRAFRIVRSICHS